jgi:tRNA nucleotidyltransferase/poly(A) polymerase
MIKAEFLDISLFLKDLQLLKLFKAVENAGGAVRFVGGAVRDALVGLEGSEIDLATNLSPEELVEACHDAGLKTVPIGLKASTTGVVINEKIYTVSSLWQRPQGEDILITEGYTDDWNADASRRDLTINAIYADEKGNVFDYYNGISDLEEGKIRFIGVPEERIKENPIRILRFFRFYALFGKTDPDPKSLKACLALKDLLREVSIEQIRDELFKILSCSRPVPTLEMISKHDLLSYIWPLPKHAELLDRLVEVIEENHQQPDPLRRLFIIYLPDFELADNMATRLHLGKTQRKRLTQWAKFDLRTDCLADPFYLNRQIFEHGKEFCIDKLLLEAAQDKITSAQCGVFLKQIAETTIPDFPLRGQDLIAIGIEDPVQIGSCMEYLKEFWIRHNFKPDFQELTALARETVR